ncbi:hypothetical protein Cni_G12638 [Canna indica]|uniref:Uncharacterized protein n=1 Tax=Canna indica TaxID=4628 RepID=A0AAQ3K874_9LILI|nr:hypothetical protein Cni_G12638 [Canna indica]
MVGTHMTEPTSKATSGARALSGGDQWRREHGRYSCSRPASRTAGNERSSTSKDRAKKMRCSAPWSRRRGKGGVNPRLIGIEDRGCRGEGSKSAESLSLDSRQTRLSSSLLSRTRLSHQPALTTQAGDAGANAGYAASQTRSDGSPIGRQRGTPPKLPPHPQIAIAKSPPPQIGPRQIAISSFHPASRTPGQRQ